jgi:porin
MSRIAGSKLKMAEKHLARVVMSLAAAVATWGIGGVALAGEAPEAKSKAVAEAPPVAEEASSLSILTSLPGFAAAADVKKRLKDQGFTVQSTYIGETLGNLSGGLRQGAIYEGRLETTVDVDLEKVANLPGLTFHADGFWIHGTGLARYYLGNLLPEDSFIEALPTVRLYELWLEQKLADGKLALRGGLLGADSDFTTSKYALLFVNSTTGWPAIFGADMPSGGPAYPLSSMGFRARYDVTDQLGLVAAIYDGDPAGPGTNDPQRRNAFGLNFRMQDRPLLMQEVQYKYNQDKGAAGLPGMVRFGSYQNLGNFPNERYDASGQPFAMTGLAPALMSGDYGVYAVLDQQVFAAQGDPTKGVGVFARVFGSPGDRNQVDFYFDTGVNVSGLTPGRSDDMFGVCFAYVHISNVARNAARDAGLSPLPDYEALLEVTYQAQIVAGWTLQPVAQYVVNPGAHLNGTNYRNATVIGLRTTLTF